MYRFQQIQKTEARIAWKEESWSLEQSLVGLFNLYHLHGDPAAVSEGDFQTNELWQTQTREHAKEKVRAHLYAMLRARDIHRYVLSEPSLISLKMRVLESILLFPELSQRWAAIRSLLVDQAESVCELPFQDTLGNLEPCKKALTNTESPLGKLLSLVALFNFDRDEERPPLGLRMRIVRGRFPKHYWEKAGREGGLSLVPWQPTADLSRFAYLAADLTHGLIRKLREKSERPEWKGQESFGATLNAGNNATAQGGAQLFSRLEGERNAAGEQMELFPVYPERFLPDLSRQIHKKLGPEGLRQFTLLLGHLHTQSISGPLQMPLKDVALAGAETAPARTVQERVKKLHQVLQFLSEVELTRIFTEGDQNLVHRSRLMTVLSRGGVQVQKGENGKGPDEADQPPSVITLLPDGFLFQGPGGRLTRPYHNLPPELLAAPSRDRPYAQALYVHIRETWTKKGQAPSPLTATAQRLLEEAGIWISPSGRYRAIETLKRELDAMKAEGFIESWRLTRSPARDAWDDLYQINPPHEKSARVKENENGYQKENKRVFQESQDVFIKKTSG